MDEAVEELNRNAVSNGAIIPSKWNECKIEPTKTVNLYLFETESLKVERWMEPGGSVAIRGRIPEVLKEINKKADVLIIDPPYRFASSNPVRGAANKYEVMSDREIRELKVGSLMENTLVFVWTFLSKRNIALEFMEANEVKVIDRLLWVKTTKTGKLNPGLGNLIQKCVEECIIGMYGDIPATMKKRSIGKEVLFARKRGNSEKPEELKDVIEAAFDDSAVKLELFGRKNNLRSGWITVGLEV